VPLAPESSVASFALAAALALYARASVTCSAAMSPYWQVLLSRALARSGLRKSLRGAWEGEVRRSGERMDAGMGGVFSSNEDRADSEKPESAAFEVAEKWFAIPVSRLDGKNS